MDMDLGRPTMPVQGVFADLAEHGRHLFADPVSESAAGGLLDEIRSTRDFGENLFLTQQAFDADPQYTGVNPRPGRNLLDRLERHLGFVEGDPAIVAALGEVLGPNYEILNRKIVCGVPASAVPAWIKARIAGAPVNNLGAFVHPRYRDITYFYGIDFHQDLIDYKDREADFLTLYVYLHAVTTCDAPLFLLNGSHRLGATVFPHALKPSGSNLWTYVDGHGTQIEVAQQVLVGGTGFAALWHACTLHGTQPDAADHERISLRYLFAKRSGRTAPIDHLNAQLAGPTRLSATRKDLDAEGAARIRANTLSPA